MFCACTHYYIAYTHVEATSTVLYTCCRDGSAKENRLPKKTTQTRKHRLSRKLEEGYCISRMMVTKREDGKVSARYIQTHTHHTPGIGEAKHLPLSQSVKQKVREKYGQNVKLDSILDGMILLKYFYYIMHASYYCT